MQKISTQLTVFFDLPFWVGVYERITDDQLEVCKITFGAEPKDYEVYAFLMQNFSHLRFSPPIAADTLTERKINPKRMQRSVKKQIENRGISTKSQQALAAQREEGKQARKQRSRQEKEDEQKRQFEIKQQKRREKHKGR